MRPQRRVIALAIGAAMAVLIGIVLAPSSGAALVGAAAMAPAAACTAPAWAEGTSYQVGSQVTYNGHTYRALVAHSPPPGAGWNPAATPALWKDLGACSGGGPTTLAPPPPTTPPPTTAPPGGTTCAVKSRPSGKVLQGYWENWDGSPNGVHPPFGWTPITDSRIRSHGYNVINAAFPVILSDGAVLWQDGMDAGVKVATPAEMCQAKAAGATILMSIGGAAAGIDLSSSAVADKFVSTVVPILKRYNFDGIDIDIETGLTGSGNITTLSVSQANLERIIDGVLA